MINLKSILVATSFALAMAADVAAQPQLTLRLDQATRNVSPTLYGLMTEEINYSYEGGLYAQLINNVSFSEHRNGRRPNPWISWKSSGPKYWNLTDTVNAKMHVESNGGFNRANPTALCLDTQQGTGITNDGFWGFPIRPKAHFDGALYAKVPSKGAVTVSLESLDGKTVYGKTGVDIQGNKWTKYTFSIDLAADAPTTKDAKFRITADEAGRYWFSRITLFPQTYNNRKNGLRPDLMTMMKAMNPKFLRFPGGNYVEGNDFRNRFDWKRTVGDPDQRPGHQSPWGYRSTDGLGLLEFMQWAEDVGAEPLVAVFAGYTLNGDYLTADYIDPLVNDALDEIEYITGGPETKWGAQRVRDGHPSPFPLHYVEIGNEDFFDKSGSYPGRYKKFYEAIKAKYPQLQLISTIDARMMAQQAKETGVEGIKLDVVDEHYYRNTKDMYRAAQQYDAYDRRGPKIFCGEWASREGTPTTNMNAALGDAAWMTCMERNSDILIANCYAPLFVNVNKGGMQWESDLIGYDALSSYGSPSYYAQCMFANNVGDKIVPVEGQNIPSLTFDKDQLPQLYYCSTTDTKTGKVYLKIVNGGSTKQTVQINVKGTKVSTKAQKTVLASAHPEDTNTITQPHNIVPITTKQKAGNAFKLELPPYSITVLAM
jgi:alpha-N-arabinofuranosidase